MVDDEPQDEQPRDDTDGEEAEGESGDGEYLSSEEGNVDVIDPSGGWGGPEQDFGGIQMGAPFQGRDEIVLTPSDFWSRPLRLLMLVCGIVYFINVLPGVLSTGLTFWRLLGLAGIPLVAAAAVGYRWWKLPAGPIAIEFGDESVEMPKGADNPSRVEVDYHDIRSLVVMVRGDTEVLLFETEHHRFTYSDADIREPNGARLLKDEIMRRVRQHPDADEILGRMQQLEEHARAAAQSPTPVTYVLIGSIIAGYVIQYATGAWSTRFGLLQIGANSAPLVADGQWWRLISANFLHGNFLHIFLNGLALLFLGISIERLIGSWRFLLIYLVTAVGGSVGSFYFTQAATSLGASTALYGLVGAFAVIHLKYWNEVPPPYRQTIRWWVVILGLNFGLSGLPMVDAAAHFAGMGVGIVLTGLILIPVPELDPRGEAGVPVKVLAGLCTAVFAAGLAFASNYAQVEHPQDGVRVVEWMLDNASETDDPRELNPAAWRAVTWSEATRPVLERALAASERAVRLAREQEFSRDAIAQYRDTHATVLYRLAREGDGPPDEGQLRRAIEIEREVLTTARELVEGRSVLRVPSWSALWGAKLAESDLQQFRAQLIRFLDTYAEAHGVYRVGQPVAEGLALELAARDDRLALVSEFAGRLEVGTELYAAATKEGSRLGAFRVCLPAGAKSGVVARFPSDRWSAALGGGTTLDVVLTDTEKPDCPADEESVEFWPNVRSIRQLP